MAQEESQQHPDGSDGSEGEETRLPVGSDGSKVKSARQTEGEALWDKPKTKMPERADRSRAMA